jgi:arylsulfatase
VTGLRFENFKVVVMEQRDEGTLRIWAEPFVTLRLPRLFNLRTDPYVLEKLKNSGGGK